MKQCSGGARSAVAQADAAKPNANVAAAVQTTVLPVAVAVTTSYTTREPARAWPVYNKYEDDVTLPTPSNSPSALSSSLDWFSPLPTSAVCATTCR